MISRNTGDCGGYPLFRFYLKTPSYYSPVISREIPYVHKLAFSHDLPIAI